MATTKARIRSRQAARRPAFLWYSAAVVSSSAAPPVSTATEEMFDSMLSARLGQYAYERGVVLQRTQHLPLVLHKVPEVIEDLRKLVNAALNLANLRLSLLNE